MKFESDHDLKYSLWDYGRLTPSLARRASEVSRREESRLIPSAHFACSRNSSLQLTSFAVRCDPRVAELEASLYGKFPKVSFELSIHLNRKGNNILHMSNFKVFRDSTIIVEIVSYTVKTRV